MRPPHYAGENERGGVDVVRAEAASMRPPHYAGENGQAGDVAQVVARASMRPPHYAGENCSCTSSLVGSWLLQ